MKGNVSVYANGKLSWAGNDPNIVPVREQWNKTFDTITAGCAYDIDYVGKVYWKKAYLVHEN